MKKFRSLLIGFTLVLLLENCSTVPITGRKQVVLYPASEIMAMSATNYDEFLSENKLSDSPTSTDMVKRTGNRLVKGVNRYLAEKNLSKTVENYQWEFNLIEEDVPNAWCMPGGKVVVYTGILPYTKTEEGLAVVMAHEIAHAIARHGNERMSQQMMVQLGGIALATAIDEKPEQTKQIYMTAFGLGTNVGVLLPFSRTHEKEADEMGMIFMAIAGYDPTEAIEFWIRMSQAGGQKPPEFLSTHPSDETRVKNLQSILPRAMKYYNQ